MLGVLPMAACGLLPLLNAAPRNAVRPPHGAGIGDASISAAVAFVADATPTPFLPVVNTPTPVPSPTPAVPQVVVIEPEGFVSAQEAVAGAVAGAAGETAEADAEGDILVTGLLPWPTPPVDPYQWQGMRLTETGGPLRLVIAPPEPVNWGNPVEVAFQVGYPCEYADHRACLSPHADGRLLLATVHSGVGGEGQALRHALEGTGFNRAGYSLEEIAMRVAALQGSPVRAEQGGLRAEGLRVLASGRVPAALVEEYFARPFDEAVALAGIDLSAELAQARAGGSALLVIETCGWRHPEEPWAPGITDTTGSVYLVVVGE